jgi:hypothetical protein
VDPGCTPHRVQGREALLAKAKDKKPSFDVKSFLSTMDGGRTVTSHRKSEKIFLAGRPG